MFENIFKGLSMHMFKTFLNSWVGCLWVSVRLAVWSLFGSNWWGGGFSSPKAVCALARLGGYLQWSFFCVQNI